MYASIHTCIYPSIELVSWPGSNSIACQLRFIHRPWLDGEWNWIRFHSMIPLLKPRLWRQYPAHSPRSIELILEFLPNTSLSWCLNDSDDSVSQNVSVVQETEKMLAPFCGADFFPSVLNCAEVASILHRILVEPSRSAARDARDARDASDAAASAGDEVSYLSTVSLTWYSSVVNALILTPDPPAGHGERRSHPAQVPGGNRAPPRPHREGHVGHGELPQADDRRARGETLPGAEPTSRQLHSVKYQRHGASWLHGTSNEW